MADSLPGMVASFLRVAYTVTMAKNTVYDQTPVDVGDDEPPENVGRKDTYWNRQVLELKEISAKIHAHDGQHAVSVLVTDDEHPDGDIVLKDGITSGDVKGGWRFYPDAKNRGHDLPGKYPGIERRAAPRNGKDGLWMRYNPVLAHEIKNNPNTPENSKDKTEAKAK
jgi:hypothetical protein